MRLPRALAHLPLEQCTGTSNLLWAEDINYLDDPNRMNVYLAENDRILSAHRVAKYLIGHGMKHRADGGGLTVATGAQHGAYACRGVVKVLKSLA